MNHFNEPRLPREGWAEAFAKMAQEGDDDLLLAEWPPTEFDLTEWEWYGEGDI